MFKFGTFLDLFAKTKYSKMIKKYAKFEHRAPSIVGGLQKKVWNSKLKKQINFAQCQTLTLGKTHSALNVLVMWNDQ